MVHFFCWHVKTFFLLHCVPLYVCRLCINYQDLRTNNLLGMAALRILLLTVPVKKKFPLRSSKTLQSRFRVGKKTLNDFKKNGDFFLRTGVILPYRCLLPTNLREPNNLRGEFFFLLQGARLSTETAAFFLLFGFFVASLFVSGCIQMFTSASRRCRFLCRQPLRHSLSPVSAFSFSHFCFSRRRLAIQSFTSPSCRRCRLLILLFRRRPLIRSLQLCRRHRRPATRFYFSF